MKSNFFIFIFIFIFILILISISFSSCQNPASTKIEYKTLNVDNNGHFKEDAIYYYYDVGYSKDKFLSDGTYIHEEYYYEDTTDDFDGDNKFGEGWVQTSGYKGTYVYDSKTYLLTLNYTQTFGDDPSTTDDTTYVWYDIITDDSDSNFDSSLKVKESFTKIFYENSFYNAFELIDNYFQHKQIIYYAGGSKDILTIIFDFSTSDSIQFSFITQSEDKNSKITSGTKTVETLSISYSLPADTNFENGTMITFYIDSTNTKTYPWDTNINDWAIHPNGSDSGTYSYEYDSFTFYKSTDGNNIIWFSDIELHRNR